MKELVHLGAKIIGSRGGKVTMAIHIHKYHGVEKEEKNMKKSKPQKITPKVSTETRTLEKVTVEYTVQDLIGMLYFYRDGLKKTLPKNSFDITFRWNPFGAGGLETLTVEFEQPIATTPVTTTPTNMSLFGTNVFNIIKSHSPITYDKLYQKYVKLHTGTLLSEANIRKVVISLERMGYIESVKGGKKSKKGGPPKKLWREKEK